MPRHLDEASCAPSAIAALVSNPQDRTTGLRPYFTNSAV
jgi:hypothetical protein